MQKVVYKLCTNAAHYRRTSVACVALSSQVPQVFCFTLILYSVCAWLDNHRMRRQLKLQQGTRYIYGPNANSLIAAWLKWWVSRALPILIMAVHVYGLF